LSEGTAPESLDHPVDNAPVLTHAHKGLTVEGYSRAAVQTYWRIPEMKLGFDLGGQPWSFMSTPNWFVSHAHLDHMAALPVYVARRRMMKMEPPTIYVPASAVDPIHALMRAVQRLDRGRQVAEIVGLEPGDEVALSRELVVTTIPTKHTIDSLGFLVWERRKKLKPEYHHLSGPEIRDLRLSGVEVTNEIRLPRVAYLGDTAPAGLDACPDAFEAEILILEMTFVAKNEQPSVIHKYGHMHLNDVLKRAERFQNDWIIASHFSTRLHSDLIRKIVGRALPDRLKERVKIWL